MGSHWDGYHDRLAAERRMHERRAYVLLVVGTLCLAVSFSFIGLLIWYGSL